MKEVRRETARSIARRHLLAGDATGWFEELYAESAGDPSIIPWADLVPNPNLVAWLDACRIDGRGKTALKVGSGLGDDAEELARRGFDTTAFEISKTAVAWSRGRFPGSSVKYVEMDLFNAPAGWRGAFDFVLESYTLQVLPPHMRERAIHCIREFVAPGGTLLVIARGRGPEDPEGMMPWPLTRSEIDHFKGEGFEELSFEDFMDREDPPVRRYRSVYVRLG